MPWEEIEKLTPSPIDPNKVYLSSRRKPHAKGGKDDGTRMYVIKIGAMLWKRLRLKAEKDIKILWGTDNLKGCIRIEPMKTDAKGWQVKVAKNTGVATIITSAVPDDCAFKDYKTVALEYTTKDLDATTIGEKALEIQLPDGFFVPLETEEKPPVKLAAGTRP